LRSERPRDVHLRQSAVIDQNIEYAGLAVQTRPGAIDLLACKESSLLENAKHIVFVVLHLGKKAAASLAQTGYISSQRSHELVLKNPEPTGLERAHYCPLP
jgi:hypothetical protein